MKKEICAPEVPASQMALTIITDEQLEAFAEGVETALTIPCLCYKHPSCSLD